MGEQLPAAQGCGITNGNPAYEPSIEVELNSRARHLEGSIVLGNGSLPADIVGRVRTLVDGVLVADDVVSFDKPLTLDIATTGRRRVTFKLGVPEPYRKSLGIIQFVFLDATFVG